MLRPRNQSSPRTARAKLGGGGGGGLRVGGTIPVGWEDLRQRDNHKRFVRRTFRLRGRAHARTKVASALTAFTHYRSCRSASCLNPNPEPSTTRLHHPTENCMSAQMTGSPSSPSPVTCGGNDGGQGAE